MSVVVESQDLNRNMPGERVVLQLAQDGPAEHVGQMNVERDRGRIVIRRQRQRIDASLADDAFEAGIARGIEQIFARSWNRLRR